MFADAVHTHHRGGRSRGMRARLEILNATMALVLPNVYSDVNMKTASEHSPGCYATNSSLDCIF